LANFLIGFFDDDGYDVDGYDVVGYDGCDG
jgi:hypothetical protein